MKERAKKDGRGGRACLETRAPGIVRNLRGLRGQCLKKELNTKGISRKKEWSGGVTRRLDCSKCFLELLHVGSWLAPFLTKLGACNSKIHAGDMGGESAEELPSGEKKVRGSNS